MVQFLNTASSFFIIVSWFKFELLMTIKKETDGILKEKLFVATDQKAL
jgi:hypothetical protein